ncbi:MAG: glutaredoxin domain-containing protein [Candidatus Pacebacteria bacterium]|nr:glutaredoxin domain-containing protein [Candidatus Paceibacterota bacterium]
MEDQKQVTIYSTPTCHFCHAAKDFFTENHIQFTDYNVASDLTKRQEMIQKSGQMGVPVIDVGGELVIGFDEDRLRELLHVVA